jgi:beta-galactosidase
MTRQKFLTSLLATTIVLAAGAITAMAADIHRKQLMNDHWQFALNDSDFTHARNVTLPHDWSIEQHFDRHAPAGNDGAYLPTGKGWYRRVLTLDKRYAGKKLRLYFEGVYMNSKVYVNGQLAG